MAKNLVIVESPAKAKTIERFLGNDFKVESSFGHIADLPTKELGVDVENNFQPKYIVDKEKKVLVKKLKDLASKSDTIWLASDEDREGEAISWHLVETLDLDKNKTKRIVFNSITSTICIIYFQWRLFGFFMCRFCVTYCTNIADVNSASHCVENGGRKATGQVCSQSHFLSLIKTSSEIH